MNRYALRIGEPLAISSAAIKQDADGLFFLMGGDPPENESHGSVTIVNIRGALCHFKGDGGDSYESIVERVGKAFASDPPPTSVVLRIESPGGVVAGLNECVLKLQRMSKAAKIPLIAYVDEMAASAAYAICCGCSEILGPPSAVIGSVGVISTMVSVSKRDEKDGVEFRLITSGKRKADGHLHAPISDDAEKAERERNAELAAQFFDLAGKARGLSAAKLQMLEAGIYLGKKAKKAGLIDSVMTLDDALYGLGATVMASGAPVAPNEGNQTDRRAKSVDTAAHRVITRKNSVAQNGTRSETTMPVSLDALIRKTEADIAGETDPKKVRNLNAKLAMFIATRAEVDGDDDGDDGDGDEDGDEDSKSAKAADKARKMKAKAEAAKHRAKAAEHQQKMAESEEAAKKCEEEASGPMNEEDDEEEDEESEARVAGGSTAALTPGKLAALESQNKISAEAMTRLDRLEREAVAREQNTMIDAALAGRRITRHEAVTLRKKAVSFVRDFLEMRPKAIIVTDEGGLMIPSVNAKTGETVLPADVEKSITDAMYAHADKPAGERATIRESLVKAQLTRLNGVSNGGRY